MSIGRARHRLQQEAVAGRRRRRADGDRSSRRPCRRRRCCAPGRRCAASAGTGRRWPGRCAARTRWPAAASASVTVRSRGDEVAGGVARVGRRRQRLRRADGEQRRAAARRRAQVQAERLLLVQARRPARWPSGRAGCARRPGRRSGSAAGRRSSRRPSSCCGSARVTAVVDDADGRARRVVGVGHQRQLRRPALPSTRRWPPADEDAQRAVVGRDASSPARSSLSSEISWSRWSSRSLGGWPSALAARRSGR